MANCRKWQRYICFVVYYQMLVRYTDRMSITPHTCIAVALVTHLRDARLDCPMTRVEHYESGCDIYVYIARNKCTRSLLEVSEQCCSLCCAAGAGAHCHSARTAQCSLDAARSEII